MRSCHLSAEQPKLVLLAAAVDGGVPASLLRMLMPSPKTVPEFCEVIKVCILHSNSYSMTVRIQVLVQ